MRMHQATVYLADVWLKSTVFTWRWWLLLFISIVPWVIWIKFRPKESTACILYGGSVVILLTYYMDAIGLSLGLWSYPTELVPLIPHYITWDFCVIPIAAMFTLQIKPNTNPFIKAIVLGIVGAYIIQPLATWIGFDHSFRRFVMRGKKNVETEFLLLSFGFNINKLHNKIQQNRCGCSLHQIDVA